MIDVLDRYRLWSFIAWVALAGVLVWLLVLNHRINKNERETRKVAAATANAVIFLCDTNQIVQALAESAIGLLSREQRTKYTPERFDTIQVFNMYVDVLQNRQPCVMQAKTAKASKIIAPPVARTHNLPIRPLKGLGGK